MDFLYVHIMTVVCSFVFLKCAEQASWLTEPQKTQFTLIS